MPELLSPQDAYALFRSSGAFLVDVRTEKEFLKKAIPGCPLLPLETLPDALGPRFAGRPVIFSAVLEGAPAKRPTCCKKRAGPRLSDGRRHPRVGEGGLSRLEPARASSLLCRGSPLP